MKVILKGILHWQKWTYDEEATFALHAHDMSEMSDSNHQYAPIKEVSFEVEIPDDFDPRPGIVEGMREQKQKLLAEAQMKANQIDEQIQQLLSIEYKPEAA